MSFKRTAGTDLNHDNWNEEEESEEAGEFKKASSDIIQQRVRKVARRRVVGESGSGNSQVLNPFSAFGGFGGIKTSTVASSTPNLPAASTPFSFLSKIPAVAAAAATVPMKTNGEVKTNESKFASSESTKSTDYFSKIKSLNVAFGDWIKTHINENPLCDLTPIFKDYEKYMKDFNKLKQNAGDEKKEFPPSNTTTQSTMATSISSTFTFGKPSSATTTTASFAAASPPKNIFSSVNTSSIFSSSNKIDFSAPKDTSPTKTASEIKSGFSFGLGSAATSQSPPSFSFGLQKTSTALPGAPIFGTLSASKPFSFGNVTQTNTESAKSDQASAAAAADEDEEPPKNDFVPVVEEDSLFSKRCKVFVKTGGADYADRGVGTLFLKKVDDKVQLVVRADTNLGNILLNIILQEGLPTSRLGKNNVMIVCLPTPDSKPPPIPVLVRVKTSDEADELLAKIEKYKPK